MNALIIFLASLTLAAGHWQIPTRPTNDMQKLYYRSDSAEKEDPEPDDESPLSDKFIEEVNSMQSEWTAGRNFHKTISMDYINTLCGVHEDAPLHQLPLRETTDDSNENRGIPQEFDARDTWKRCISLHSIRDQGPCGSDWAISAASVLSDRLCIATNATKNLRLSAQELISCCNSCGCGCMGGFPAMAWPFFKRHGLVTGGDYASNEGCKPYEVAPCNIGDPLGGCRISYKHYPCSENCKVGYETSNETVSYLARNAYSLSSNEDDIKTEILKNGPVQAQFGVYADFLSYKSGVYHHVKGNKIGSHAVRVLGWGVENDIPYWLVDNSWSTSWGDQGYFKMRRGNNECGFESRINAGLPKI